MKSTNKPLMLNDEIFYIFQLRIEKYLFQWKEMMQWERLLILGKP